MSLTDKQIEQMVKGFENGGYDSVVVQIDGEVFTWGNEGKIINMSLVALVNLVDRIQSNFQALAEELKKIDKNYNIEKESK
jgi:hypothetical protein